MDRKEAIDIPFGVFDSELKGWEYTIPEGFKARIEGNKVILELKESEDERIRKGLIDYFNGFTLPTFGGLEPKKILAWLEKQGEQKPTEWSEEDEEMMNDVIGLIKDLLSKNESYAYLEDCLGWLKFLKERYTWKPSDEQMKQLDLVVKLNKDTLIGEGLMTLFNDLKKLKG